MFTAMPTYSLPPAQEAEILTQIVKEVEQALGQSISNYGSAGNG